MRLAAALALVALPVAAQDQRPAPEYFLVTVMATTTAQQLAVTCPTLAFDISEASRAAGVVMSRLQADGFVADQVDTQMLDPSPEFSRLQATFMAKHGLDTDPTEAKICAAGAAEIAEGSAIGAFLNIVQE